MADDIREANSSAPSEEVRSSFISRDTDELADLEESAEQDSVVENVLESQYCVFRAGRERFCLTILGIEEVVDWPVVTRVPLAPSFLVGVFNLRGSIVPLIDIAFTEGRRTGLLPRNVVIASVQDETSAETIRIGIAADEVIGTYTVADDALLEHIPSEIPHCRGMLRHDDRLALVLDLKKLLEVFPVPVI